ncbi:Transposase [Microdochium nivale]|nr:Transposase [Microdochium nivale]
MGYRLPWSIAAIESGLEVTCKEATIRDRMRNSLKYHTCKSTVKDGLSNGAKKARIQWAQKHLQEGKYDNDNWLKTNFSMDEVHFGFQPSLTTKVHRRPEDKYEWWTVQAEAASKKKKKLKNAKNTIKTKENDPQGAQELENENEQTLLHVVCAVGYNFRSKLYWYTIPTNKNSKMSSNVLIPIL